MAQLIKKENITIVTGIYKDAQGNEKKRYKTIAELITMKGDDGSEYQFGEMWGPHGVTKFNVYAQDEQQNNNQQNNQQQNNNQQQQGNYQQNNQQQGNYQQGQGFQPQQPPQQQGGYQNQPGK